MPSLKIPKIVTIITAAGFGSRMDETIPKQYLKILDKTLLEHSLAPFLQQDLISEIIIAHSPEDRFIHQLKLPDRIKLVHGGTTRAKSVFNALVNLDEDDYVLVHDSARCCLHQEDLLNLLNLFRAAFNLTDFPKNQTNRWQYSTDFTEKFRQNGVILAEPVVDTIKQTVAKNSQQILTSVDRDLLWKAMTPQFFNVKKLKQGLEFAFKNNLEITDEASALELLGLAPLLLKNKYPNFKITFSSDLKLAQYLLQARIDL